MTEITARQALHQLTAGTRVILRGLAWAGEWRETLARWILAAIAGSVALTGAALHPWLWPIFGIGWMAAAFAAAPELEPEDGEEDEGLDDEPGPDDEDDADGDEQLLDADLLADTIHAVANGGNVHLTAVRDRLHAETGQHWDVLAACRAHGIPTKPVRVAGADPAVTTGIHRTDLPPLPQPLSTPGGVVSAGHPDNNNTNNGITVQEIGEPGRLIKHGPTASQEARR
jgi:hypothetical protein